jgi:hypothetical protein
MKTSAHHMKTSAHHMKTSAFHTKTSKHCMGTSKNVGARLELDYVGGLQMQYPGI